MTTTNLVNRLIKIAKKERKKETYCDNNFFIVSATFNSNNIIAIGINSYIKTHPYQAFLAEKVGRKHKIFLHAEIDALIKTKQDAFGIITLRFNTKGELRNSKPCPVCELAIKKSGIKKIIYFDKELIIKKIVD